MPSTNNARHLLPCSCRGPQATDPCGHADTSAGCPRHAEVDVARFFGGASKSYTEAEEWVDQYPGDAGVSVFVVELYPSPEAEFGSLWVFGAETVEALEALGADIEVQYEARIAEVSY